MSEHRTTKPARLPPPARPGRHRRHARPGLPHVAHRIGDDTARKFTPATGQPETHTEGGGGSSGRGPVDDGGGRQPDRDGDAARDLLIALGLIVVGASVLSARLLTKAGRSPHST